MNGTFVVWESGVTPLADRPLDWPEAYRRGVAAGLLIDSSGSLAIWPHFIPALAVIVAAMAPADWNELSLKAFSAPLGVSIADSDDKLGEIREALANGGGIIPAQARESWDMLKSKFCEPLNGSSDS